MADNKSTWIKPTKTVGIFLFLLGLIIFTVSLSLNEYQLTNAIIQRNIKDLSKQEVFLDNAKDLNNKKISSKFTFLNHLTEAFEKSNEHIIAKYKFDRNDIDAILESSKDTTTKTISYQVYKASEALLDTAEEIQRFKKKTLKDYTNWIEGKTFQNTNELKKILENAVLNINSSIIYKKGFDTSAIKNYRFIFTKESSIGTLSENLSFYFWSSIILSIIGALVFIIPQKYEAPEGIKNNGIYQSSVTSIGWIGIILGTYLIGFYIFLYEFPEYITNWVLLFDPVSKALNGNPASQWFLYGFLYTLTILVMGLRMIIKYRHSKHQILRTCSVMFFQTSFAFIIIQILERLNLPAHDLKNIWPLDYSFFFEYRLDELAKHGALGYWMLAWGISLFVLGVPIMTFFFGKRWYCSWVCGCGGLAETLGDPFRQLSNKSLKAWKFERITIHSVLIFAIIMTTATLYTYFTNSYQLFGFETYSIRSTYGFLIGTIFSGIVGTGFYPLMGNRVWCRFACPLAAYLGIIQRFKSRFRITTNGGQCISCGNCSTYCEMGIDVRWYAQRGQDIIRSSCVGCGICSAVCPRGVLRLENGTVQLESEYIEKKVIN